MTLADKYWKEEVDWDDHMEALLRKAQLIADHKGKGEVSMLRLREWVLSKGKYPQHLYERTPLEVDLEFEIDKVLVRNEYDKYERKEGSMRFKDE